MGKRCQDDRTDAWVRQVNALAREMDEKAASLHPSAWPEVMKDDNERFRKLASGRSRKG